jgi:hypothetical protein
MLEISLFLYKYWNIAFIYHWRSCDTEILPVLSNATYITDSPFYRTHEHALAVTGGSSHRKSDTARNLVSISRLQINLHYFIKKSRSAPNYWCMRSAYDIKLQCSGHFKMVNNMFTYICKPERYRKKLRNFCNSF